VCRDRVVVGAQHRRGPRRHRLLTDREMQKPADLAQRVRLRRLLLEATNQEHVAQQLAREAGVEPEPGRRLLCHCLRHALPPAHYSIATIVDRYQRIRLRSSTERRRRSRKMATMIASPTATSAAATAITKKTTACPSAEPSRRPNATNARFAALSMSSMDMKMMSGSRRTITPTAPMVKSTADSPTYQDSGTMSRQPSRRRATSRTPTIAANRSTDVPSKGNR